MESRQSPNCLLLTKDRYFKESKEVTDQNSISRNCENSSDCTKHLASSTEAPDHFLSEHVERHSVSRSTNFRLYDHCHSQWHCSSNLQTLPQSKYFIYQSPAKRRTHLRLLLHTFWAAMLLLLLANPIQSHKSTKHTTAQSLSKSSPNVKDIFYLEDSWMVEEIDAEESSSLHKPRLSISESSAYVGRLYKTSIKIDETRYEDSEIQYKVYP